MKKWQSTVISLCICCLILACTACTGGTGNTEEPAGAAETPTQEETPASTEQPSELPADGQTAQPPLSPIQGEETAQPGENAENIAEPEPTPELPTEEQLQPLLDEISVALYYDKVTDFDAARGNEADRYFVDTLLYNVVNYVRYDPGTITVEEDEESGTITMPAESMQKLLHGYIGDYPALLTPPPEGFFTLLEDGRYEYFLSDIGDVDFSMKLSSITYIGEDVFEATAQWQSTDAADSNNVFKEGTYTIWFSRSDEAFYDYTVIHCAPVG